MLFIHNAHQAIHVCNRGWENPHLLKFKLCHQQPKFIQTSQQFRNLLYLRCEILSLSFHRRWGIKSQRRLESVELFCFCKTSQLQFSCNYNWFYRKFFNTAVLLKLPVFDVTVSMWLNSKGLKSTGSPACPFSLNVFSIFLFIKCDSFIPVKNSYSSTSKWLWDHLLHDVSQMLVQRLAQNREMKPPEDSRMFNTVCASVCEWLERKIVFMVWHIWPLQIHFPCRQKKQGLIIWTQNLINKWNFQRYRKNKW